MLEKIRQAFCQLEGPQGGIQASATSLLVTGMKDEAVYL
jgi:hypothetical protein